MNTLPFWKTLRWAVRGGWWVGAKSKSMSHLFTYDWFVQLYVLYTKRFVKNLLQGHWLIYCTVPRLGYHYHWYRTLCTVLILHKIQNSLSDVAQATSNAPFLESCVMSRVRSEKSSWPHHTSQLRQCTHRETWRALSTDAELLEVWASWSQKSTATTLVCARGESDHFQSVRDLCTPTRQRYVSQLFWTTKIIIFVTGVCSPSPLKVLCLWFQFSETPVHLHPPHHTRQATERKPPLVIM